MKKIYLSVLLTSALSFGFAQSTSFIVPTKYRGAFAPNETQWTDQWTNWDPQNTNYPAATVTVSANITVNTTWTADKVYLLTGQIYVKNGATLTIEPGTIILGDKNSAGAGLFITQGAKLIAQGTVDKPIVFTSNQPAGQRALGDWGGIILMGKGSNNNPGGIANIEGIAPTADTQYGGGTNPDDNDNSGILKYVRVEYAGYVYAPNKEINAITFGAVGRETTVDYVQVSFANDDAYEWFGGSVNCKHLVSYRNLDDDFDTDNGFAGSVQFALSVRDPQLADNPSVSTSEAFESDNNAAGDQATPQTIATFANMTLVGPLRGDVNTSVASGYRRGARIRRNSALKIYNSIFIDHLRGIHIDGTLAEENATAGTSLLATSASSFPTGSHTTTGVLKYKNNLVAGYKTGYVTEVNAGSTFAAKTWFNSNNNDSVVSSADILVNPYGDNKDFMTNLDFRPKNNSIALTNYAFDDAALKTILLDAPTTTASINYCVGETATALSATANSDCNLVWRDVNGTIISTPTPSTTNAGTFKYYVSQKNSFNFEGPSAEIIVQVNALPTAPVISANGSTSICTGSSVSLNADKANGIKWSTNETTQQISVNASGTYKAVYTDANGCKATSNEIVVNVSNAPTPTIQAGSKINLCSGDSVVLTSTLADGYTWSNTATTQAIIVKTAGTYYVTTTNTNACNGVGQSNSIVVTLTQKPTASFTYTGADKTINFTNNSTNATSYSWDFGDDNSSSGTNPVHIYPNTNAYTVKLIANNNGCSDTATVQIANLAVSTIAAESASINVYPNPMGQNGTIAVNLTKAAAIQVNLIDFKGSLVQEVVSTHAEAGSYEFGMATANLENGVYYLVVRTDESVKTIKLNILK